MNNNLKKIFGECKEAVDKELDRLTPAENTHPAVIHTAMRYSLFAGGKRLRPALVFAVCSAIDVDPSKVVSFSAALEMIHTYTLIHDDLPALDDDDLRRGNITCHKKFGEANAILAGDALLTLAFEVMTDSDNFVGVRPEVLLKVTSDTARDIGTLGTIGGQVVDLEMEKKEPDLPVLEYIHTHKTGKLIVSAVRGSAILAGASPDEVVALTAYAKAVGLAFQVADDILDVEGNTEKIGKRVGGDEGKKKLTYPALIGMDESKIFAEALVKKACGHLEKISCDNSILREIAHFIVDREN